MDRRTVLKGLAGAGGLALTGGLSAPAIAQGASARTLRFVPQANLANFDPIWGTQYVVRNAAALVWDTLYGVDAQLQPQRQMVESEEVTDDGTDLDVQAAAGPEIPRRRAGAEQGRRREPQSLGGARSDGPDAQGDPAGAHRGRRPHLQMGAEAALPEDAATRSARTTRRAPSSCRSASPRPTRSSRSTNMSAPGPMKFAKGEWVPGAKAVFEKFADYVPRQEKASWLAGGKQMLVDRVEWIVMPDPATAAAALQNGEIDWWENPIADLVPVLKKNKNISVDIGDPLGNIGSFRMNHPVSALQRREGAARGADGAEPGRLHARARRRRQFAVEAAARLLHAGHAALHRSGRRDPEG